MLTVALSVCMDLPESVIYGSLFQNTVLGVLLFLAELSLCLQAISTVVLARFPQSSINYGRSNRVPGKQNFLLLKFIVLIKKKTTMMAKIKLMFHVCS